MLKFIFVWLVLTIVFTFSTQSPKASSNFRKCYWCSHTDNVVRLVHPEFPPNKFCEDSENLQQTSSSKQCSNPSDICIKFSTKYDSTTFNVTGRGCITMSESFPKGCLNTTASVLRNFSTHSLIWQLEGKVEFCSCDGNGCNGNIAAREIKTQNYSGNVSGAEIKTQNCNDYGCPHTNSVAILNSSHLSFLALLMSIFCIYLIVIV